jgi:predicted amidohydrolase YtcJ
MKFPSWIVLLSLIAITQGVQICSAQNKPAAELIILNAKVWTVDKALPSARAVAVLGDRVVAVGGNAAVEAWRGPNTRVIDAGGKLLLPGFNDSHVHFVSGGMQLDSVDLKDAANPQEFARLIGERAKSHTKSEWIVGGNWDETKWNPPDIPSKELIDAITPETPVFVTRYDGHMGLANSFTLRLAGITASTPDPPGGTIVRDGSGNPTGALKDAAADLVFKIIPPLDQDQRLKVVKRAMAHAASLGVTSVQHMGPDAEDISVYAELLQRGELTVRIYAVSPIPLVEDQVKVGLRHAFGGPFLRLGGLKGFADGSLGSGTAYFYDPFLNQGENRGLLSDEMQPLSLMRDRMMMADSAACSFARMP